MNSVAIHTARNAPLDPITGMPIPHIAGATSSGLFIIKPDGSVLSSSASVNFTAFAIVDGRIAALRDTSPDELFIYADSIESYSDSFPVTVEWTNATTPALSSATFTGLWDGGKALYLGHAGGLDLITP